MSLLPIIYNKSDGGFGGFVVGVECHCELVDFKYLFPLKLLVLLLHKFSHLWLVGSVPGWCLLI